MKHLDVAPNNSEDNWAIIFRINGVYTAICPLHNQNVTFNDELGVTRTIVAGNWLASNATIIRDTAR